ncbi:MAG: AAA family ATPase [Hoeflea sp.]|uniref:AAA family ATPase n=1 Tax=Hoeflea sp. TaxID=1940281 RepID=UPI003299B385
MHKIKSITVDGFRGQSKPIQLALSESANFLIGRNGTGKTSLINLINACLSVDGDVLRETNFTKVTLRFKEPGKATVPILEVEKLDYNTTGLYIRYSLRAKASAQAESFELSFGRRRVLREIDGHRRFVNRPDPLRELEQKLSKIFRCTWLSLHRGNHISEERDMIPFESEYESEAPTNISGVDHKLGEVLENLKRYYFLLDRRVSDQTRNFQKDWFLSFLATGDSDASILNSNVDFEEEKKAIAAIFDRFEVAKDSYTKQLEKHVTIGKKALEEWQENKSVPLMSFFTLYDVLRLHGLVQQWQTLQELQKEILVPKSDFVNISSGMLYKKVVKIDQGNEVNIYSDDEIQIPIEKLSSGEKQLIIFLAETLLQEGKNFIFLADEPELSLHVEWQEQLVSNLFRINPNAQVLFATHSPDIVGSYNKNLFSMEELVQ